ncbi:MAG: hypothetical protein AAGE59_15075 [Cyanobacteria bacterium P01_F01_bin.86]
MTISSQFTATERLASLKAASLGGACAGIVSLGILGANRLMAQGTMASLIGFASGLTRLTLLVNLAIAILSGALFALTYRYAVRQDENPQLKAGVVLAFTLVRGLAQVDAGSAIAQNFWPFLRACSESFLIFGVGAIALTLATQRQWIRPFGNN